MGRGIFRSKELKLGCMLLLSLTLFSSFTGIAYAGAYFVGCRASFLAGFWTIIVLLGWEDAGSQLPMFIDLYRVIGGARIARIEDRVSGTGSREYTFDKVAGQSNDRFIGDLKFWDAGKDDWVHHPNRPGTMECPRPATQTETTTLTVTTLSTTNVTERETVTVQVDNPPSGWDARFLVLMTWFGFGFVAGIIVGAIIIWLYLIGIRRGAPPTPPPQSDDYGA